MIERIYNIILWRIYSFLRGTTKLLNGINPFTWLLQPVIGISIWSADRLMMLSLFFWLLNCNMPLFNYIGNGSIVLIVWIIDVLLVFLAQWCFAWRKDKYQKYFKTFEKQPLSWKIIWGIISFLFVITPIILIFIG